MKAQRSIAGGVLAIKIMRRKSTRNSPLQGIISLPGDNSRRLEANRIKIRRPGKFRSSN